MNFLCNVNNKKISGRSYLEESIEFNQSKIRSLSDNTSPLVQQYKAGMETVNGDTGSFCPFSKLHHNNNHMNQQHDNQNDLPTKHNKSSQCPSASRQPSTSSDTSDNSSVSSADNDILPFVVYLMSQEDISMKEISSILVELMMGGIDTVSLPALLKHGNINTNSV